MQPDTTMQLATIRQDELLQTATRRRATSADDRPRTRWGRRAHRGQGARS
jgi:hypothetical protein